MKPEKITNVPIEFGHGDYERFCRYLEQTAGITLGQNKEYLVCSRIEHMMLDHGLGSLSQLLELMQNEQRVLLEVVDAMTTNETSWFRDQYPYDALQYKILPELATKSGEIKIWSTACSTGQEPYSISMIVSEFKATHPGLLSKTPRIVGTDVSPTVLRIANEGQYEASAFSRGLSEERKERFFKKQGNVYHINKEIRQPVHFMELNLVNSFSMIGKCDVIFCRNVLVYFGKDLKADILQRLSNQLKPGGYLILGGPESVSGYTDRFELIRWKKGVLYRLKP